VERAGLSKLVDIRVGAALETLPKLAGPFDLTFVDADKQNNAEYFLWALKLSPPGRGIGVDNGVAGGAATAAGAKDEPVQGGRRGSPPQAGGAGRSHVRRRGQAEQRRVLPVGAQGLPPGECDRGG